MTPTHLKVPIQDFRRKLRERKGATNSSCNAFNACFDTSLAFSWFCIGGGIKRVRVVEVGCPVKPFDVPGVSHRSFVKHFMVCAGRFFIDWTARQFWANAPYPMIMDRSEVRQLWKEIM